MRGVAVAVHGAGAGEKGIAVAFGAESEFVDIFAVAGQAVGGVFDLFDGGHAEGSALAVFGDVDGLARGERGETAE